MRQPDTAGSRQARRRRRGPCELRQRSRHGAAPRCRRRRHARRRRAPRLRRTGDRRQRRRRTPARGRPAPTLDRGARTRRTGRGVVDGPSDPVRRMGVGGGGARHTDRVLVWLGLPPGGLDEPASRVDHDGHARVDGHAVGVDLVDRGTRRQHRRRGGRHGIDVDVDEPVGRRRQSRVLRDRGGDHRVDPDRQMAGDQGEASIG